jgi:hypothetical protein
MFDQQCAATLQLGRQNKFVSESASSRRAGMSEVLCLARSVVRRQGPKVRAVCINVHVRIGRDFCERGFTISCIENEGINSVFPTQPIAVAASRSNGQNFNQLHTSPLISAPMGRAPIRSAAGDLVIAG